MPTNNAINTEYLASSTDVKLGTNTLELLSPSTFSTYMTDMDMTGFFSWGGAGAYFDDTTLGTFQLLRGGNGYVKGKLVTWVAQNIAGLTAGNCYWIYIDSSGTIGKATARTDALYRDNIILFECLRDSTPVTNNQVTVKENHPYAFSARVETYLHDIIGTVIENSANGANIAINGTQGIQINGADELEDEGLDTNIPDSGGVGVTWIKMYTNAGGKWARQNATTTFTGYYNAAGTPTALGANKYGVYTLYASKDNLNATTPTYFAVLDTTQYNNLTAANNAIGAGTTAKASNELFSLELCQLGYIIYNKAANAITSILIAKTTARSSTSTSGANQASLINVTTTGFTGWLGAGDTTVQQSLADLDQVLIGGTANYPVVSNGAGAKPTFQKLDLTAGVTGVLPIANGGTNASSFSTSTGLVKYDGTSLVTSSAAKMDSTSRITNSAQPCFSAYKSAALYNVTGNGAEYKVIFNSTTVNQGTYYDTGTGEFTAPVAGNYIFAAGVGCVGQSGCTEVLMNIKTSAGRSAAFYAHYTGAYGSFGSIILPLSASTTVYVTLIISGLAGNTAGPQGGSPYTFFSGCLLC